MGPRAAPQDHDTPIMRALAAMRHVWEAIEDHPDDREMLLERIAIVKGFYEKLVRYPPTPIAALKKLEQAGEARFKNSRRKRVRAS